MLQQNGEYRSNERKADQHFNTKVNAQQVGPHFGSNSPLYEKMSGVCPGVGDFGIDW